MGAPLMWQNVVLGSALLLPAAACPLFGRLVGRPREGWALLLAMLVLFVPFLVLGALLSLMPKLAENRLLNAAGALGFCVLATLPWWLAWQR